MSVVLTKDHIDHIKNYKYSTNPLTYLDHVYTHWWDLCMKLFVSERIAPNLITLMGITFPIISMIHLGMYDLTTRDPVPNSVVAMFCFSAFWF
jgi:hypothetical protein